jgi:hypothetical protein
MIRVIITQPDADRAPHIHEVRLHRADSRHFFACFNVTERDEGRELHVSMFLARDGAKPPPVSWWRDFAAKHFPRGESVGSDRMDDDGKRRPWLYRFRQSSFEIIANAALSGCSLR